MKKIFEILSRLLKHELISGSFYVFVGGTIANFLAFIYNLYLAKTLVPSDYGIYGSLLSLITLVGVPVQSLGPVVVKFAADYFAKGETNKTARLYLRMSQFIFLITALMVILFVVLSGFIRDFLHIDNTIYVIFAAITISFFYLNLVNSSFIQSVLKFKTLSFISVIASLAKLLIGIALISAGFKIMGAVGGVFAMAFTSFVLSFIPLRFIFKSMVQNTSQIPVKEIFYYALPTAFAIFFLTSFTSTDVILVKHFFNPHQAGFYAGLSLVGKVIFYFTNPIPMVMFPLIIKRNSSGKSFNSLFYLALILVFLPSIAITAFYFIYPSFVIRLFLSGKDYLSIAPYLGYFGIYLTVFSVVNVCISFFLSLNKMRIVPMVVIAAILQAILIVFFHNNFYEVIGVSIVVSLLLLISLLSYYISQFGRFRKIQGSPYVETVPSI
ncbi:oligosaccharide flippase family protein [Patescibacteria group bacterium]|nr:oligosaccharide flippase family protein [Patescibacteria group bacterium]